MSGGEITPEPARVWRALAGRSIQNRNSYDGTIARPRKPTTNAHIQFKTFNQRIVGGLVVFTFPDCLFNVGTALLGKDLMGGLSGAVLEQLNVSNATDFTGLFHNQTDVHWSKCADFA